MEIGVSTDQGGQVKVDTNQGYRGYRSGAGYRSEIHRGYSNFLLNMAFISPSEVENIYSS